MLLGWAYSAPPLSLNSRGLGELSVALGFGILIPLGADYVQRGAFALASVKAAFNARHGGVAGLSRMAHDLLLRDYLDSEESKELSKSFGERRLVTRSSCA